MNKEAILLNSFEALKDDANEYSEDLAKIIANMQDVAPETACQLWSELVEKNTDSIFNAKTRDSFGYKLTSDILSKCFENELIWHMDDILSKDETLLEALFEHTPVLSDVCAVEIATQIYRGNYDNASAMLQHVARNKKCFNDPKVETWEVKDTYVITSMCRLIQYIAEDLTKTAGYIFIYSLGLNTCIFDNTGEKINMDEINREEVAEFLLHWTDSISDAKEKAKAKIYVMGLLNSVDKEANISIYDIEDTTPEISENYAENNEIDDYELLIYMDETSESDDYDEAIDMDENDDSIYGYETADIDEYDEFDDDESVDSDEYDEFNGDDEIIDIDENNEFEDSDEECPRCGAQMEDGFCSECGWPSDSELDEYEMNW